MLHLQSEKNFTDNGYSIDNIFQNIIFFKFPYFSRQNNDILPMHCALNHINNICASRFIMDMFKNIEHPGIIEINSIQEREFN